MSKLLKNVIEMLPELVDKEIVARKKADEGESVTVRDVPGMVDCDDIIAAKAALDRLYLELGCPGV